MASPNLLDRLACSSVTPYSVRDQDRACARVHGKLAMCPSRFENHTQTHRHHLSDLSAFKHASDDFDVLVSLGAKDAPME